VAHFLLSFDDHELVVLLKAAESVPPELRGRFLNDIAVALSGARTVAATVMIEWLARSYAGVTCTDTGDRANG
jgi:hypothetical protein